jgi:hypothetical protein
MSRTLLEEANDPTTSTTRLQALAQEPDLDVTRAVSLNPNTPFVTLEILWRKHPESYWQNPAVELFQLEDPSFFSRLSDSTFKALVQCPEADEAMLRAAAKRTGSITLYIAKHPNTPPELLDELVREIHYYQDAMLEIAKNPKALPKTIELLVGGPHPELQRTALSHHALPTDLVPLRPLLTEIIQTQTLPSNLKPTERYIIARCGPSIRELLAKDEETSPALLVALSLGGKSPICQELARDDEREALGKITKSRGASGGGLEQALASRKSSPSSLLTWLYRHSILVVRMRLAENPSLPTELYEELMASSNETISLALLKNPMLPKASLQKILTDHRPKVISQAVKHPNASEEMFGPIYQPARWRLRENLARDTKIPSCLLNDFIEDEHKYVSNTAQRNPNASKEIIERLRCLTNKAPLQPHEIDYFLHGRAHLRRLLWDHPQRPAALVESFLLSTDTNERLFLARETRDPSLLERLAQDKHYSVVTAVLKNPGSSPELLRSMYDPKDTWHCIYLAQHINTPVDILESIYQQRNPNLTPRVAQHPKLPRSCLLEIAKTNDHGLLSVLGRNPHAPPEIYDRLPLIKHRYIHQNIALQSIHLSAPVSSVSARVLRVLAQVKSQDERFLLWALDCPDPVLAEQIAANPNTPTKILEALAQKIPRYESETLRETLWRMLRKHPNTSNSISG